MQSFRQFLILSLGIIVRMWSSDRAPASKPGQDISSCWSGTLAMQHPDLKCSSGFVVICSSQLSQYRGALLRMSPVLFLCLSSFPSLTPSIKTLQSCHPSLSFFPFSTLIMCTCFNYCSLLAFRDCKTKLLWFVYYDKTRDRHVCSQAGSERKKTENVYSTL